MTASEQILSAACDSFEAAAVGASSWAIALERLAAATGSRSGQLIGVGSEATVPFNLITKADPEGVQEFLALNGGDPRVNPRVRAGRHTPELYIHSEADFLTADEFDRSPIYKFYRHWDVGHCCQTTLIHDPNFSVGLSVLRSEAEGAISDEERRAFTVLAPRMRSAVRIQMTLQSQGAALVAGAMEALSLAVFVCDGFGRVQTLSPKADELARRGSHISVRRGRLVTASPLDGEALALALQDAAFARTLEARPPASTMAVRDRHGLDPLTVEVAAIPGPQHSFGMGVAAIVIVHLPQNRSARGMAVAKALFDLTPAETLIVGDLLDGRSAQAIAERTGVSVGTVRTHIRRIFFKAEVHSQIELIALITARL